MPTPFDSAMETALDTVASTTSAIAGAVEGSGWTCTASFQRCWAR